MSRRRAGFVLALLGAAVAGAVAAIVVRGGAPAPKAAAAPPLTTATVVRTNLSTTTLTQGTLGYGSSPPVVNRMSGTYTALPSPGTVIGFGQALYWVDNAPVVLMQGTTPAWRPFAPGMTDGPDVAELQSDLVALGDASGLFTAPSGQYDMATVEAVERWQQANGMASSGQISLGGLVFLPTPVLVGSPSAALGQPASPGDAPYAVTTTTRVVTVPLNPNLPTVNVGESVSIVLPTNATTPGTITTVDPAPANASSPSSSSSGGASSAPSAVATVAPVDPAATGAAANVAVQVSLVVQSVNHVLAAPISALLALSGGGYGVEVVGPSGARHLVGVTTGASTGSQVQISGPGIQAGTKVVVAQ